MFKSSLKIVMQTPISGFDHECPYLAQLLSLGCILKLETTAMNLVSKVKFKCV